MALFAYLCATSAPAAEISLLGQIKYEEAHGLMNRQKWPEAAAILRSVLSENAGYLPAVIDLSKALAYASRREEALELLARNVEKRNGPRDQATRDLLVRRLGVLSRVFFTNDSFQQYQEGLNFLQARKYGTARESFQKVLATDPTQVEVLIRLGQAYVLERDFDGAVDRLRYAKKLNPYEPETRLWLGRALHRKGEIPAAIEELRFASKELPSSELAPLWLSETLLDSGQRPAAIKLLEQDAATNPFHLRVLASLARLRSTQPGRDLQPVWMARKELQLALSRLPEYGNGKWREAEGELGLSLATADELKAEIQALLLRVEARLESKPGG